MSQLPSLPPGVALERGLSERFRRLAAEWKQQSRYLSNLAQMAMLRPYQQIIGMGPTVVPLLLEELRREPDHWFWAQKRSPSRTPCRPKPRAGSDRWPRRGSGGGRNRASSGMKADPDFPRLAPQNHRITSPAGIEYNCVAWAAGDTENWWQPGVYWPVEPRDLDGTGQGIGLADPMIAAIALNQGLELVTGNTAHFQRIQRLGYPLTLVNWRI